MNLVQKHLYSLVKRFEVLVATCLLLAAGQAFADVSITLKKPDGSPVSGDFSWLVEEDRTFDVVPGLTGTSASGQVTNTLSLNFHRSYMPVVAAGKSGTPIPSSALESGKRYFVSVMPTLPAGATGADATPKQAMSGAPLVEVGGAFPAAVTVISQPLPLRTSQISVFLFNDNNPINNQPDAPGQQELGLCGFDIHLYDAGGTYGASGGRISVDVFGNPLGTTYPPGNTDGSVILQRGTGTFRSGPSGVLRIRNLAPAKYTIYAFAPTQKPSQADCPAYYPDNAGNAPLIDWPTAVNAADNSGAANQWLQTTTIEGTSGQDAWVKANEPGYFREFGPPGHHVFIGFVARTTNPNAVVNPAANGASVSGRVVNIHSSRPPAVTFFNGKVVNQCRIGINEAAAGTGGGKGVYAGDCKPDGTFNISGLERGRRYQLAVWDKPLDNVFATYDFFTPATGDLALNDVPVFSWFSRLEGYVFNDIGIAGTNIGNGPRRGEQDGFRQNIKYKTLANGETREISDDEPGIAGQAVNIRFRDGSIYQSVKTDDYGYYEFPEFFPFFNWMVAEVDYLRHKATGATIITDNGGAVPPDNGWSMPSLNKMNPQPQFDENGAILRNASSGAGNNNLSRTEVGPVLLAGMQDFLGQTNVIHWGKAPYVGTESGGITGIVHYASTRAEWDPTYATAENNEPGIPGVTVKLYKADPNDYTKALGAPIRIVQTDSWDDALPTNCQGAKYVFQGATLDCYDGLRNFNQVRPAVFDGGYAFWDYYPDGQEATLAANAGAQPTPGLPQGYYIVEVVPPVGYEVQKEEDKNVDFGDVYQISTLNEAVGCVGTRATPVPQFLKLFPDVEIPAEYRTGNRPLCDRKAIEHFAKQNTAVDFHLFTEVPVAGHIVGMILDDLANEFDPNAPAFGEKYAPPFMPVSLRDHTGHEFSRVYSDIYGAYNALVPSTFSFNVPIPSGVSPNMVTACLNSPTKKDGNGGYTLDPHFNRQYSQFCYTFNYLPGKTTYLDTPVLPIAAFAGPQQYALDCDNQDKVPGIHSVSYGTNGPWVPATGSSITIKSMGVQQVSNPLYNQETRVGNKLITRDYGFGATQGQGQVLLNGVPLNITTWTDAEIVATVDTATTGTIATGQLMVKRGDSGQTSMRGVTLHIGGNAPIVVQAGGNIQAAIDGAPAGSLITVAPGLYEEAVIVHKRVRLQGFGAGGVYINPLKEPAEKLAEWRAKACNLAVANPAALLPGQALPGNTPAEQLAGCLEGNPADNAPLLFGLEESAGILVFTSVPGPNSDALTWTLPEVQAMDKVQIDGFTISGADHGGGIVVNGKAPGVEISNNRATGNLAPLGGGIRIGQFELTANDLYVASRTQYANIHNNEVTQNGNGAGEIGGGGGGISLYTGTHDYKVANNFICGNFSTGNGGGMAHVGISNNGVIEGNTFLHNQSFFQQKSVQGGGLSIEGLQSLAPATANLAGISTGSGNVKILNNLFQGNAAGAGDGGAISLNGVNGNEVLSGAPYQVEIYNNTINNNVAGVAGGGIALQDAFSVKIINNTITRNDSTATGSKAFNGVAAFRLLPPGTPGTDIPATTSQNTPGVGLSTSTAQPGAGVASRVHSPALARALSDAGIDHKSFSDPVLKNNIVWQNRTFYWSIDYAQDPVNCQLSGTTGGRPCFGLIPNIAGGQQPVYSDFGVIGGANTLRLTPTNSVLTSVAGYNATNVAGSPNFLATYFNGARNAVVDSLVIAPESQTQNLQTAAAFDEGGNFIDLRFGPLTPTNPNAGANFGKAISDLRVPAVTNALGRAAPLATPELQRDAAGVLRSTNADPRWTAGAFEAPAP